MSADGRWTDLLKTASARFIHARDSVKIKIDVTFEFVVKYSSVAEVDWMTMTKMANALIDILTVHTKLTQHDDL